MSYRGKWALVTGASSGLGAGFARTLAQKGANVALTARRADRLEELAAEIKREHAVETFIAPADLANPLAPGRVVGELQSAGHHVDILINNAGYGLPGYYLESEWEAHRDFLELMVTSYAHFVRLVLPSMIESGWGRIIQVSSLAGLTPGSAGHTMYGASKAFLVSYSQSLAAECDDTGVHVSALCPGFTYTEFHDANNSRELVSKMPKYMFMEAQPVIDGALRAVEKNHVVYVPGAVNKFIAWLAKALPRPWAAALTRKQSARFRRKEA